MKAFLLGALLCEAALATTLVKADLAQLTRQSDVVVVGQVTRVGSRFTSDRQRIVTDTEIAVSQAVKGEVQKTIVVMQPGGEVGDLGQKVAGVALFTPGEEVVVFLERRGERYFVVGLGQGKYKVQRSSDGKAAYAVPPSELDATLVDPVTREHVSPESAPVLLEVFLQRVAAAAGAAAPAQPAAPPKLEKGAR